MESGLKLHKIVRKTEGFSGADMVHVVTVAVDAALAESTRSGSVKCVSQRMLERAAADVRPSIGPWLETARNYAVYGNDAGQYDDLVTYLASRRG